MLTEHQEQCNFVQWFRTQFPSVLIYATPNGGNRHVATAAKLKKEGVVAGVPDLFIPQWRMFIEMKREKGGVLSQAQKEMIEYLRGCGYIVVVAAGCNNAIELMRDARNER